MLKQIQLIKLLYYIRKNIFLCILINLVFLQLPLFAQEVPTPAQQIIGQWKSEEVFYQQGAELNTYFEITDKVMVVTGTCDFHQDQVSLMASVVIPIEFSGNDILLTKERHDISSDGFHYCRLDFQPARWSFYFDGLGNAVLFTTIPYSHRMKIVRMN